MPLPSRILKVFSSSKERAELSEGHELIESYESFLLLRVSRATVVEIGRCVTNKTFP